jgi:signal transduction histidine kinase/ActR/RegA family two-component response regulator
MPKLFVREFDARAARSALTCLWLAVAIVLLLTAVVPTSASFLLTVAGGLAALATTLTALGQRLSPRLVSRMILGAAAAALTTAAWYTGGPASPSFRSYAVAIVGASWLMLAPRAAALATICAVSLMAGLTYAETQHWLPASLIVHTPWTLWLTTAASVSLLAVMQRLNVGRVDAALAAADLELTRSNEAHRLAAQSERRFAEVVATVPGVVYEFQIDAGGTLRFTFVSEGARRLFDVDPAALLADAETLFAMVETPSQLHALRASIARAHATLEPWEIDGVVRTPAGRSKWIRGQAVPTTYADGSVRWHGVLSDISARRHAEQALSESRQALRRSLSLLQSAFDSTADGLLVVSADGRVTDYNQKLVSLWRVPDDVIATKDDQQLLAHAVSQLVEPEAFMTGVQHIYQHPEAVSFDTLLLKDGRCFERYSQPQVLDGAAVGRVWSFRDVTARLEEERRRAELEDQLQQAQTLEALGTLSGGIAHDFNNLLTVMMGHAEAALLDPDEEHRRDSLQTIGEACVRASDLVRQIREFSQPRPAERAVLTVAEGIGSAIQLLRTTMPKSVDLAVTLDPTVTMFANATQVQQVVTNLIVNAAQAIGTGAGRITVTLDEVPGGEAPATVPGTPAGRYARLTVRDTGRGIAAELLPRIFDPFFTTKTASPGSGLGLAVVQGIVRRHAGAITVESTQGSGTTVRVYWPALAPDVAAPRPSLPPVPAAPAAGDGRRILVVDDEPAIARVVAESLRRAGYVVVATTDSREARRLFMADPRAFDAVLSDVAMPNLSGVDLGRELLARRPDVPIVLFTGYSAEFGPDDARAIGFRAVISKPVTTAVLAEALHRALQPPAATARDGR